MAKEVIKTIKERRSIRAYKKEQITDVQLDAILEAGAYAASGMGTQATEIVSVQDPETIALMSGLNAKVMGMDSSRLIGYAREHPERIQFPFQISGNRLKIPRIPFLRWLGEDENAN